MLTIAGGILLAVAIIFGIGFLVLGAVAYATKPREPKNSWGFLIFLALFLISAIASLVMGHL